MKIIEKILSFGFTVLLAYLGFVLFQSYHDYEVEKELVKKKSSCIYDDIYSESLSTDLITCLCEEWGGDGYALQLEPGVQVNACILINRDLYKYEKYKTSTESGSYNLLKD